jgi:hypothetical protein
VVEKENKTKQKNKTKQQQPPAKQNIWLYGQLHRGSSLGKVVTEKSDQLYTENRK